MEKKIKLLPPTAGMPNFLPTEYGESGKGPQRIPIEMLTLDEAIEYGDLIKESFVNHWKKKTKYGK